MKLTRTVYNRETVRENHYGDRERQYAVGGGQHQPRYDKVPWNRIDCYNYFNFASDNSQRWVETNCPCHGIKSDRLFKCVINYFYNPTPGQVRSPVPCADTPRDWCAYATPHIAMSWTTQQ